MTILINEPHEKKKLILLLIYFLNFSNALLAQGEGNIWYIGSNAGLDFNGGAPVVLTNGALATNEGCASISNAAGSLLFYTDGITVWNTNHIAMPNGTGLLGDPSATQSGIIVPKPGSQTIYYVFTVAAIGGPDGLRYSEVDMTLDGGLGDVTAIKNIPLATPVTEKITAVKKANGTDFWVIAHDFSTTAFLVYSVTSTGVNTTPVISNAGSVDNLYGVGYLKASTDGSKLVQAIDFINIVDVLNFNNLSGVVTSDFSFSPPTNGFGGAYGVEFSPDVQRLYVGVESTLFIYQYNLSLGTPSAIINSETLIGTCSSGSSTGALQIAPDGKIYIVRLSDQNLACISNPNALGNACGFVDNAVDLLVINYGFGLPNFIQTIFQAPEIAYNNPCFGDTTYFSFADTAAIDSVMWNFSDSASGALNASSLFFPSHVFSNIGSYNVSAITYSNSIVDTAFVNITISGIPDFSIGNDTLLCNGNTITLDPGSGYLSYLWQNASTNQTYVANVSGSYYVTVSNYCGAFTDTINILASTITVNNPTICYGDTATLTANGATNYTWNNGSISNTLVVSPAITTTYIVTATDTNGCFNTATSTVTVNQPVVCYAGPNVNICLGDTVQLNATGGVNYFWSPMLGLNNSTISNPISSTGTTTNYTVTDTDSNNCTNTDDVLITVYPTPDANFSVGAICVNNPAQFTDLSIGGGSNLSWNFGDGVTSTLTNPVHSYTTVGSFTVTLNVTNSFGCNSTISIPVTASVLPSTPILTGNSPICAGDDVILSTTAFGDLSYLWTGPNSFINTQQNFNIQNANESMSGSYTLHVTSTITGCVSKDTTINVIVNSSPAPPIIEATTQLCYGDTLLLMTSSGAATYLWNGPNGYTSDLQNPSIIEITDNNVGVYTLIISNANGCTAQDTITVLVDCDDIAELFVPNVFTPNGDNENQIFKIVSSRLKELSVEIYDRWGIQMNSWNSLDGGWDGKTKIGLDAPSGTYYYIVNATYLQGSVVSKQGSFTLFR
jgi:gliding motility-associated-like protein